VRTTTPSIVPDPALAVLLVGVPLENMVPALPA
jgi:hypothetical protein